ncbi:MAG: hypothetical protein ACT4N5_06430 [Nitrosopumilaceae archaeon]
MSEIIHKKQIYVIKASDQAVLFDSNKVEATCIRAGASKKCGDKITKNEVLFSIYAEKSRKLTRAQDILNEQEPVGIGKTMEMFIHMVKEPPVVRRAFVLDR